MRRYLPYIGYLLAGASLVFLFISGRTALYKVPEIRWEILTSVTLLGTLAYFLLSFLVNVRAWVTLLRGSQTEISMKEAYSIMGRAQIAKYLPGNVFHFFGRVAVGTTSGLSGEAVVMSMGVESVVLAGTAILIGAIGVSSGGVGDLWLPEPLSDHILVTILGMAAGFAIIVWSLSRWEVVRTWLKRRIRFFKIRDILVAALLYAVVLLVNGFVIEACLAGIWGVKTSLHWYELSSGFSLAWLAGFVAVGVPGGVGVREAAFVLLFGDAIGGGLAIGVAIVLRLVTSVADLVTFGIAIWAAPK